MKRWLALASATLLACSIGPAARADVSWDFIITAAINNNCPSCPIQPLPITAGTLSVSDNAFLRGSLFYAHEIEVPPVEDSDFDMPRVIVTGDTDFHLFLGFAANLPMGAGLIVPHEAVYIGIVDLLFSPDGKISGQISNFVTDADIIMFIADSIVTQARWGSDNTTPACATHTQCIIDGYWQLTSPLPQRISEPSSIGILAGAVVALGLLGRRNRRVSTGG